jgi:hypothetical protein
MTTADGPAPSAKVRPEFRRAAAWLACAAVVASSAADCKFTDSGTPAAAPASASTSAAASASAKTSAKATADPACPEALEAVSSYGPTVVREAAQGKEILDKAEIDLIVLALNGAAKSAGNSKVKQSIINLLSEYLQLRDSLSDAVDSAVEQKILANTSNLKSDCGA